MQLSDVRALVPGGAQGMGHAFTQELRNAGARVAFCDIDADGVTKASQELDVPGFVADVSDEESVNQLFSEASDTLGGVNVLINNAGIIRDGLFMKVDRQTGEVTPFSTSKWQQVINVNLTGPFFCMRAFTEQAIKDGIDPAVAINMSSISRTGNKGQVNYSAAKAGLVSMTTVWAKELARYGVRVGAIAPGFIRTPMVESMRPEVLQKVISPVPLKRLGEPFEIFQAVRFIVECEYFTGRVLEVDGGLVL